MIKTTDEWIAHAKVRNRSIFFYDGKALDLTSFMFQHPGGRKILTNYTFKDITETIFNVFPHKREHTVQVLMRYVVGSVKLGENKLKSSNISEKKLSSPTKDKKKVLFDKKFKVFEQGDVFGKNNEKQIENNRKSPAQVSLERPKIGKLRNKYHNKKENKVKKSYEVSIQLICDSSFESKSCIRNKKAEISSKSHIPHKALNEEFAFEQIDLNELNEYKQDLSVPALSVQTMNRV